MSRNNFLFSFISIMSLWLTQSQLEQNKGILFNGILIIVTVFGALFFSIIIIFLISIEGLASLLHRLLNPFPLTRLNEKLSQKVREMSLCFCLPWFCLHSVEFCLHSVLTLSSSIFIQRNHLLSFDSRGQRRNNCIEWRSYCIRHQNYHQALGCQSDSDRL